MKNIKNNIAGEYLRVIKIDFKKYKSLADKTFDQLEEGDFYLQSGEDANSIGILIQHISGNLISRFTDFFESDGEKPYRNRDTEFEDQKFTVAELLSKWNNAWKILFDLLDVMKEEDLTKTVLIRNEPHSVIEALNRQLSHYGYHVGQIVLLAKQIKKDSWKTLSVAKGKSNEFNNIMFNKKP